MGGAEAERSDDSDLESKRDLEHESNSWLLVARAASATRMPVRDPPHALKNAVRAASYGVRDDTRDDTGG
jgi:hypothetical protein